MNVSQYFLQVLNPKNSICERNSRNKVCITQLRSTKPNHDCLLVNPDDRFVIEFGFHVFTIEELFLSNKYYKYFCKYSN